MPSEPWEEIARRCEEAGGPIANIDAAIHRAADMLGVVRSYTGSVDASLALIGEKLPGCGWGIVRPAPHAPGKPRADIFGPTVELRSGEAATPALALCAAFARAMAHQAGEG